MTCAVVTPWWRRRSGAPSGREEYGSVAATPILDRGHPRVAALVADARNAAGPEAGARDLVAAAHGLIQERVRPVYAMDDTQPVSRTLARGRGSCSQRLAVLEAVARAFGVRTRVRGLVVDGSFWYPRFPRTRYLVPSEVVLAWPEFRFEDEGEDDGGYAAGGRSGNGNGNAAGGRSGNGDGNECAAAWVPVSELFGSLGALAAGNPRGFTNTGTQTLFEALARTAVDWDGSTCGGGSCSAYDLSASVLRDLGRFPSRDALFAAHGQTLCPLARVVGDAVLGRRAAA
ncbi:transglutaminase domain-containing protein [Streptomyces sp. NPDC047928]|uniref:transglutaminase domain-containing protein n=1 Tax=unclassified Streptomyces TaxID=2593676 RepID=UPI00371F0B1B